jgi:Icc-related predicted phosphoesterase
MRLLIVSDLHFEFHRDRGKSCLASLRDADVLVCAGDLSDAQNLWDSLLLLLSKYKHVVFVFGNHEFYGSNIPAVREKVKKLQDRLPKLSGLGSLHVLDNSACEIERRRFIGSTLWFTKSPLTHLNESRINDFYQIGNPHRIYDENERALTFLKEEVTSSDIVVTHHLPSHRSVHPRYVGSPLNPFFVCDIEELIAERQPKIWIHGHTHSSCDYVIGTTQVLCNPLGYVGHDINPAFLDGLILDV